MGPERDIITLGEGTYRLTRGGGNENNNNGGDLDFHARALIEGVSPNRTFIDGTNNDRIIDVHGGVDLTIEKLTFQNARPPSGNGGAIETEGDLNVVLVDIKDCSAPAAGGGIYMVGGDLEMDRTQFISNHSAVAGGMFFSNGEIDVNRSTFSENSATAGDGGALAIIAAVGQALVRGSTFDDNASRGRGAGVWHDGGGFLRVTNSTFFKNDANHEQKIGGLLHGSAVSNINGTVILTNNTFSKNSGRGLMTDGGEVDLGNNLIDDGCWAINGGVFTSRGGNLETSDDTCYLDGPGDQTDVRNLDLSATLGDHGGWTKTLALTSENRAVDVALNGICPASDQRGKSRPENGAGGGLPVCDAGSFELGSGEDPEQPGCASAVGSAARGNLLLGLLLGSVLLVRRSARS